MPDLFDIDYNQQANDLLPPDKRVPDKLSLLRSLLKSLQWGRDLILGTYKKGWSGGTYSPGAYNKYDQVKYGKSVYESLISSNTDNPTVTTSWMKICDNFIGVDERVKYNGQKIVLEYALNKEFDGVFRQPGAGTSDIYLSNLSPVLSGFRIGQTETGASSIGQTTSSASIGGSYPFVQIYNFTINIPTALHSLTNDQAIRAFTLKYIPSGINFSITIY